MKNMKRTPTKKNIDRHKVNYVNRNVVFPVLYPVTWSNSVTSNVKIVEINSDESKAPQEQNPYQHNNTWFDDKNNFGPEKNKNLNNNLENFNYDQDLSDDSDEDYDDTFNSHDYKADKISNNQEHLFTINKNMFDDTSSDTDIEIINDATSFDNNLLDNNSRNEIGDLDYFKDNRSIWLYSFNNEYSWEKIDKSLNSSKTSTSSTNSEIDSYQRREILTKTPLPNFIPKLNLPTSPLPTLSEVTEPNKQSSSDTADTSPYYSKKFQKSINTWLDTFTITDNKTKPKKRCKLSTSSQRAIRRNKLDQINLNNELNSKEIGKDEADIVQKHLIDLMSCFNIELITNNIKYNDITDAGETSKDNPMYNSGSIHEEHKAQTTCKDYKIRIENDVLKHQITSDCNKNISSGNKLDGSENERTTVYDYDLDTIDLSEDKNEGILETSSPDKELVLTPSYNVQSNENVPYLHLSSEANDDNTKWLKRLFKFINCCK